MRVTRRILCILAPLALLLTLYFVVAPMGQRAVVADPMSYTVKVVRPDGHGSAVHIGGGVYLTAAHVVSGVASVGIHFDTGITLSASVLAADTNYDIAILMADKHVPRAAARLSCRPPASGTNIRLVGNPLSVDFVTLRGYIAGSVRRLGPWALVAPVDATVAGGMSGGPVINESGEVVGITVGAMRFGMGLVGIGTIVPGSAICDVLSSI